MSSVTLKTTWSLSQTGRLTCPGSQPAAARGRVWAQDGWLEAPNLLRVGGQERNKKKRVRPGRQPPGLSHRLCVAVTS